MNNTVSTIAVCGAGTMGSGIAQVAAQSGFPTILYDLNKAMLDKAKAGIEKSLNKLVEKNKISEEEKNKTLENLIFSSELKDCKANLIVEAIVEKAEVKIELFNSLSKINGEEAILATNTSSLSVSALQSQLQWPGRFAGMHFFNPAPVMKLVEVVKGDKTELSVIDELLSVCRKMKKTAVVCRDAPGFIVNRVARHYYLEAMKLVEEGVATFEEVDQVMEASGFRMGPFKLMDLIGMDINLAVSESIYEAFGNAPRFKPSSIQKEKVKSNELGVKTGKGFYNY